jgi:hypothetical protein
MLLFAYNIIYSQNTVEGIPEFIPVKTGRMTKDGYHHKEKALEI